MKELTSALTIMAMYILSLLFVQEAIGEWVNLYCAILTAILVFIVFPLMTKTRD